MVQRSPSPPASCSRHQPSSPARGWCWATVLLLAAAPATLASKLEFKHHNNTELAAILQQVHNQCPDISRLYTLSEPSVRGVPLYVLEFSDKPVSASHLPPAPGRALPARRQNPGVAGA